jgi:hypothetical protein
MASTYAFKNRRTYATFSPISTPLLKGGDRKMTNCRMTIAVFLLGTSPACTKDASAPGGCTSNSQCDPGQVCRNQICETVCRVHGDCSTGLVCRDSTCVPSDREPPTVSNVDGGGTTDGATGYSANHLSSFLRIEGENLTGSTVKLTGDSAPRALEVCSEADTELIVLLPEGIEPGTSASIWRALRQQAHGSPARPGERWPRSRLERHLAHGRRA